ncbi:hypothetical protein CYMTET_40925 [Cymbomonas tetramitiformis]|uniref:Uncharacterized protein n=1 Tax=Cymbomonas tetramitiformis TaxID=36881 RepID=A0AAE0C945_9CHLO|nr:hypothetical protein CYMTET_40925 [Cymbomonas tetramitiformis]
MYAGPEGPQNFKSGLNGKSPNVVDNRNDCTIYETKSFEMPDLPEPVDVTKRQRAIGEFFLMQDEESSMDRHMRAATERCMSAQRSIAIYDEDVDTFVEVRLIDAFEHDALIQNDGFTAVGDECEGYGDDPNDKYEGDTSFGDLPHNEKNKNHMPPLEDGTIERFASTYFDGITENDLIVKMHANVPSYLKQMDYVTDMGSILNVSSMTEIFKDSSSVDSAITTHTDAYAAWLYAHTIAEHSVRAYACDELFFRYTESVKRYDECMPLPPCLSDKIGVEQTILAVLIAIRQNNPIYYSTKYESDSIKNIYKEFHDKDDGGSFDGTGMYLTGYKITKRIYESMSIVGADSKYTSRTMKVNPIGYNNYAGVKLLSKCDGHECYQPNECKALIEAFDTLCDGMDVCFEFTKDVKQSLFGLCILKCTYAGNLTVNTKNPESNEDNSAYALTRHAINDFNSGEDMRLRIFAQSQSTENGNTSMNGLIISPFKAPSSFKNVIIGLTAPENGFFARIKNTHFDTEKRGVLFGWLKANKDRIKNCNTLDVEHDTLALIYHHAHNPSSSSASHTFLGMPSVQINAMPTGTEQFWVTRAFLRRFNDSVHSKRPHEYFIYTLMCMQKTGPKFLRKVINENKLFPFGYLLLRPYQTYETCTAILMKGGAETGETLIGYYNFQLADNVVQKMHYGNFTIYEKSVVYRSRNVLLQPDIMVTNYLGGGGSKFYNDKRREDAVTFSTAVPSLYACLIGYNEQIKDNPLDVTGKFASHTGLQNIKETMYSTAGYYKDKYQFEHANAPSSDEPYFEQPVQKNTLCFQGHQARYNYQTGGLDRVTLNTGHWGERVYPGCGKVRKGLSKYLEPVTYSHMYHGGGMMMGSM